MAKEKKIEEVKPEEEEVSQEEKFQDEMQALLDEIDRLKNDYARAYADTENMRKRLQQEADTTRKYRIQSFASEILPVIDNLERALAQPIHEEAEGFKKGVEMIYTQLIQALKNEGVEEIEALNQVFDANLHQAIMVEKKEGVEPGIVIEVLQKGYKLKDRILRASMVKVSE